MDDAAFVGVGQGAGYRDAIAQRVVNAQRSRRKGAGERRAIHELHRDERQAVFGPDFVDCADVGMVQRRGGLRFAQQALVHSSAFKRALEHLDRQRALENRVERAIDGGHAARTDECLDAVSAELCAGNQRGVLFVDVRHGATWRRQSYSHPTIVTNQGPGWLLTGG